MADEQSAPRKRAKAAKAAVEEPAGASTGTSDNGDAATAESTGGTAPRASDANAPATEADVTETTAAAETERAPQADRPPEPAPGAGVSEAAQVHGGGRSGIPVPFTGVRIPVPNVPLPRVPLPSQHDVIVGAVHVSNVVRENRPSADQLLYYGGLGALAAFGVVDWPVAAAIGAGVWIARRHGHERRESEARPGAEAREGAKSAAGPIDRSAAVSEASEPAPIP
jgi:hypothetical protein